MRILVVDDEPAVAELVAALLSLAGHEVRVALSGPDALVILRTTDVDVVLSDLTMPFMNGQQLRDELLRRGLPVARRFVFMCGSSLDAEALELTGAVTVTQPFNRANLEDSIQQAAGRG